MGILLPPVSQITTTHHRNRSLDSALQRIPEVDITPSPECEGDLRVPGVKSNLALSDNNPLKLSPVLDKSLVPCSKQQPPANSQCGEGKGVKAPHVRDREDLTSLGSDDSGICGSDGDTRESSVERLQINQSRESLDSAKSSRVGGEDSELCEAMEVESGNSVEPVETPTTPTSVIPMTITAVPNSIPVDVEPSKVLNGTSVENGASDNGDSTSKKEKDTQRGKGFLLRLFESKHFDMSMAITYLFNSKEPGVQSYIGE